MDIDFAAVPAALLLAAAVLLWLSVRHVRALRARTASRWIHALDVAVLGGMNAALAAVAIGSCLNALTIEWSRAFNPEPGADYLVNGLRMHLNCTGQGQPTIVLDAGLGWDSQEWGGIQPRLSRQTRVCSYDRAGFGLSQAARGPRDADHIAVELHRLLAAAGESGPFVLLGHSIGGMYVRDYAARYPKQVAGLVFVDSSSPLQNRDARLVTAQGAGMPLWASILAMRAASIAGYPRWRGACAAMAGEGARAGFGPAAAARLAEDLCGVHYGAVRAEFEGFDASGLETARTGPYGSLPLLVISQDTSVAFAGRRPTEKERAFAAAWDQMQARLARLSTRSRRVVAAGSTHDVPLDRPELIEREVSSLIGEIRAAN